jgi:hypothetical protein
MPKNKNPLNPEDKVIPRIAPELTPDDFSDKERKKIAQMIEDDYTVGIQVAREWILMKEMDIQHYDGEKPINQIVI